MHSAWHFSSIFCHGKRSKKSFGSGRGAKKAAERSATEINSLLRGDPKGVTLRRPLACDRQLRLWLSDYSITLKPTTRKTNRGLIENHLVPFFGSRPLDSITERELLRFVEDRSDSGLAPKTIKNALGVLRRVYNILEDEGSVSTNPAKNIGSLMRRVENVAAKETKRVEPWTRREVEGLLGVAREHEPDFAPFLSVLFATGLRRGEAMALKWTDINFDERCIDIRRSISTEGESTPKSGKSRRVQVPDSLMIELFDLLAARRQSCLSKGWPEIPEWVFCSQAGTSLDPSNINRPWVRVRRRAQAFGVRPLRLHDARHTWATFALLSGKNIRWVSEQLGHADPAFTLRVYAHVLREDEVDLSFADFSSAGRPETARSEYLDFKESPNYAENMVRREGFEPPTLRFEA